MILICTCCGSAGLCPSLQVTVPFDCVLKTAADMIDGAGIEEQGIVTAVAHGAHVASVGLHTTCGSVVDSCGGSGVDPW